MDNTKQSILVGSSVIAVLAVVIIGVMATQKLERVAMVAERTEAKLDRVIEAAAPLGEAAVEKGVNMVKNVDEQELAQSAEKGIKDIGDAAKGKVMKWIDSQEVSPNNKEVPNLKVTIEEKGEK